MRLLLLLLLLASPAYAANLYVRSTDGSDADNGSTWALAKATLSGALSAAAAGDTIYVSQAHVGTTAATVTLTSPGTAAAPCRVICANDAAEPPTATATTATVSTTGTNSNLNFDGFAYYYGIGFSCGSASNCRINFSSASTPYNFVFDSCKFTMNTVGTGAGMSIGIVGTNTDDGMVMWKNCQIQFGHANQTITVRCPFEWRSTASAVTGATFPTALFKAGSAGNSAPVVVRGVDLSALTSNALVDVSPGNWASYRFENCKLGSGYALTTGSFAGPGGSQVLAINCDSGDTNYRFSRSNYSGTISTETTIVRGGGATDGTTAISRKMVSSANSAFYAPLESQPLVFWNESTSSQTVTVHVVTDNVTLTDAEAWIEVDYLGTSGFPLGNTSSDRIATVLTTPANQTTDAVSSWTTTGLTTPVKQDLAVTFTAAEKGPIRVRVVLAKPSTTLYFDPLILSPSGRQYQTSEGYVNEGPSSVTGGSEHSSTFVQ